MLFLLRNLRRKLMKENKVTSYLLYATGEIALVVIGILIAVQIDDWNNERKNRIQEIRYLQNIKLDLQKDLAALDTLTRFRERKLAAANVIMSEINGDKEADLRTLSNSTDMMMFERKFVPNNTTFRELSSSGNLNLISNDTIKNLLFDLENRYKYNEEGIAHETFDYREYISRPIVNYVKIDLLNQVFLGNSTIEESGIRKADFEGLLQDRSYRNGVTIIGSLSEGYINLYRTIQSKSSQLSKIIDREIAKNL